MITIILIFFAGILNACMDVLQFKYENSIFRFCKYQQWVNPARSWINKWKKTDELWNDGIRKERFFGSSTFLVFLTDFWHLCKFLMLLLLAGAAVFYHPIINWWVDLLLIYSIFTIIFELFYSIILIRKIEHEII